MKTDEKEVIQLLAQCNFNIKKTSKKLGISTSTLYRYMNKNNIQLPTKLEKYDKDEIINTVYFCNGNIAEASRILQLPYISLYRYVHRNQLLNNHKFLSDDTSLENKVIIMFENQVNISDIKNNLQISKPHIYRYLQKWVCHKYSSIPLINKLKKLHKKENIAIAHIATSLNVHKWTVYKWFSGGSMPNYQNRKKIISFLKYY